MTRSYEDPAPSRSRPEHDRGTCVGTPPACSPSVPGPISDGFSLFGSTFARRERSEGTTTELPSADRRALRREAKIAWIVEEAWALSRTEGLTGISLRHLADRLGLRQPSFCTYFDSKTALFDAMFADGIHQLIGFTSDLAATGNPERDLAALVERLVRFASQDAERHQLLFQRTIPGFEPSPATSAVAIEFLDRADTLLRAAGVTKPADFDLFTDLWSGLAHQQAAFDPGGDRWVRLAGRVVAMFLTEVQRTCESSNERPYSRR